jgi:hypothetical protein
MSSPSCSQKNHATSVSGYEAMSNNIDTARSDEEEDRFVSPFECPICFEIYNNDARAPTTFPCGHSCCLAHCASMKCCHVCRAHIPNNPAISYALRDAAVIYIEAVPVIPATATTQIKSCYQTVNRKKKSKSVRKRLRSWCCIANNTAVVQ